VVVLDAALLDVASVVDVAVVASVAVAVVEAVVDLAVKTGLNTVVLDVLDETALISIFSPSD